MDAPCSCEFKPCACVDKRIVPEYTLTDADMEAVRSYARVKACARAYYHKNAEVISARRKEKYRAAHPNAIPRPNRKRRSSSSDGV